MGKEMWIIHVLKLKDKNRRIEVSSDSTSDTIIEKIAKLISENTKPEDVQFVFGDQTIVYGSKKLLKDLNILDGSSVVPVIRVIGGGNSSRKQSRKQEASKPITKNIKPLPGYITVTSSRDDEDIITLDDDPKEKRAKMPCGHAIGSESMTSYCRDLLSKGKSKFNCPKCDQEWPYFLVRHVACLTGEEITKLEEKLMENHLYMAQGIIQCPGCKSYCFRDSKETARIQCQLCVTTNRFAPDFCWYCLREWKGYLGSWCGNSDCDGIDKRIKVLASCPTKKIFDLELPSIRGCPNCGMLIEHVNMCKHMACKCKHEFCFSCLKPKKNGEWECTYFEGECGVAPRQTRLPGC